MDDKLRIDSHKLNYHPERIASWIKKENIYPIYIEIATTSACNHRCTFCALDFTGYKGKSLNTQVLLNTLTEMGENGIKSIMFSGDGEPTLHKDFALVVKHSKKHGLDVALTTNGIPFTKKMAELCLPHLSWIKFSVDAGTPETYAKIHRTKPEDLEKVMVNIKHAVDIKDKNKYSVKIGVQLLLLEENADELTILAKKVKAIGADYISVKPYSQHPDSLHKFKLDYEKFKTLQRQLETLKSEKFDVIFRSQAMNKLREKRIYAECYGLPFYALIDAEGNVMPCNLFHGKEDYYYGNLYKNKFSEIWNSKRRKKVVKRINVNGITNCRKICRLDSINCYLHYLKNPPEHVNFI